jgi:hypothetical protein
LEEQFEHIYRTGSGWTQSRLTLADETAQIEYDASWMSGFSVRYTLHCTHQKLSNFHGLLSMSSLEQFHSHFDGNQRHTTKEVVNIGLRIDPDPDPDDDNDEFFKYLNMIDIEYIRLPEPQIILPEPGGKWGISERLESFSLILLTNYAGYWADEDFVATPLGRGLESLNTTRFAISQGRYELK